jgi:hypothetical protein
MGLRSGLRQCGFIWMCDTGSQTIPPTLILSSTRLSQTRLTGPRIAKESGPLYGPDIKLVIARIVRVNGLPFLGDVAVPFQQRTDLVHLGRVMYLAEQLWFHFVEDAPGALQGFRAVNSLL